MNVYTIFYWIKNHLKLNPNNDAGTGVDNNHITNRFGQYNVFHFIDECKELKLLLDWLRNCYLEFMHSEGTHPVLQCDMVCWYNIPRDNKNLNEHVHSCNENSYPSGNMQLSKFETVTNYRLQIEQVISWTTSNFSVMCSMV